MAGSGAGVLTVCGVFYGDDIVHLATDERRLPMENPQFEV